MKKLMTMIAAVATAFGLYAADTGTSFEGDAATAGGTLVDEFANINELSGGVSSADWWWSGATDKATIKEYGDETPYSPRPAQYTGSQFTYLKLETGTEELTRYADSAKAGVNVLTLTDKEYVFDSLVNLTAFDDAPVMTDSKLAVWLQDLSEAETPVAQTNLMVSMLVNAAQVNYNCGNLSDLNLDLIGKWARVTIKALDIGNSKIGFVVYINGSNDPIAWTTAGASIEYGTGLNDVAQFYADKNQLFPYAGDTNIGSVGFKGMGSVDDLVFTETVPNFAADPSLFALTVGSGITSFTATYNGVTKSYPTVNPVKFVYSASANPQKVILSNVVCADGKFLKTMEFVVDGSNITIPDAVVAVAQVGEVQYDDLNEAVAAASGKTLKLLANATNLTIAANMTLDLNGKTIEGVEVSSGKLTVEDNGAGGKINGAVFVDDTYASALFNGGLIIISENDKATLDQYAKQGYEFVDNGEGYFVLQAEKIKVDTPTATDGLVYNGKEQTGVATAEAYKTISGNAATAAGNYTAVITLKDGYVWRDAGFNGEVTWSIATVAVTVTADAKTMKAGEALPTFTYQITSGALIDGETLKGTLTVNTDGTKAGEFDIVQANDWVNNNYDVTYVGAKLTVESAGPIIDPTGGQTEATDVVADDATAAETKVISSIKAPTAEGMTLDDATYRGYFKAKAVQGSASGKWNVTLELDETKVTPDTTMTQAAASLSDVIAGTATEAEVTNAKVGLWYSFKYSGDVATVKGAGAAEGNRVQAKTATVSIPMPKGSDNARFWVLNVSTTDKPVNQGN